MLPEQLKIYDFNYYRNEHDSAKNIYNWLKSKNLRFGDMFAALCYAHGITYLELQNHFKEYFKNNYSGEYKENNISLKDQLSFVYHHKKRTPKKILEIGGGKGEFTIVCDYLNYDITCVEPSLVANQWFTLTSQQFFGKNHRKVLPFNKPLSDFDSDLSEYDTIVFIESIEHILENEFEKFYDKLKANFKGYLIIVNWIDFWPIPIGTWNSTAHLDHCRLIDDELYDRFSNDAKSVIFREGSHLILEF